MDNIFDLSDNTALDFDNTINDSYLITENNKLRNHLIYRAFAGVMQIFAPFM